MSYSRDKLGRIVGKTETIQGETAGYVYRYDAAGRLEEVERDGVVTASYTYDANGNRLAKTTPEGTETGTYDDQDRMTAYGAASFTYTANGDLLARVDPEGTTAYDYDVLGNLRSVSLPDGPAIDYLVDARHRRIGRKVDGTLERGWLWASQLAPAAELDAAGQVASRYVHATRVNVPDLILRDGTTYRLLSDPLGSPRLAIDTTSGAVVQRMDYDEWGVVLLDTNPGWQPFGFGGGLYDHATSLVRFGWRDYGPVAGRWTSKDPIGFHGLQANLYAYLSSDPLNAIDSDGLQGSRPGRPPLEVPRAALVAQCEALRIAQDRGEQLTDPHDQLACEDGEPPRDLFPGQGAALLSLEECERLGLFAEDQLPSPGKEDRNPLERALDKFFDVLTWFLGRL